MLDAGSRKRETDGGMPPEAELLASVFGGIPTGGSILHVIARW